MPADSLKNARRRRLLGIASAFIIGMVIALGALEIVFDYRKTMDDAFERLEQLARVADESVSGRIRAIDVLLQDVGRESLNIRSPQDADTLLAYMKARVDALDEVRSISITDGTGRAILTTRADLLGFDASQRPYYTIPLRAENRERLFIHGPTLSSTGAQVLFASRARQMTPTDWDGVTLASLPPEYFVSILETVNPGDGGFAALLSSDGTIASRFPKPETFIGQSVVRRAPFAEYRASGQRMTRSLAPTVVEERPSLVVTRGTAYPELVITVGLPQDVVLREWRDHSLLKGGILALVGVIATGTLLRFSRHEDELRAQRNFAQQLVQNANVLVVGLDRNGIVRIFNETAADITGYRPDEIIGRDWFDTVAVGGGMPTIAQAFAIGAPLPRQFDGPIRTKNGHLRRVSWQNSVVTGQDIVAMSFGIDITERIATEEQLKTSKRFIQAVTDSLPGMVGYWDAGLRCRFANKSYLHWFGKPPEAIIGHSMVDLLGERLFAQNEPYIRRVLRGEPQNFERILTKPSGEVGCTWAHYIPDINASGAVIGFFVLVNDITPLKRAEDALRATMNRLSLATKAGGIGVWEVEYPSRTLRWDDRMFQLYGKEPMDGPIPYEVWRSSCLPEDLPRVERELEEAVQTHQDLDTEFRIVVPGQGIRHIKTAALVDYDESGQARRIIGVNWDITSIREKEAAFQAAQWTAEKANRAKSEFLANMSHEIRTPLNAILGLSHLLGRTDLNTEQQDFVSKITQSGRGLLSIINDILDFSRVEAGRMELDVAPFDLSALLDAVSTIMSVSASTKDLELLIDLAPDTPVALMGDASRLRQVLINLTSNAIKFTETGTIMLRVEAVDGDEERQTLRFSVEDSGIGIAAEALPLLFTAFSQADSSTTRRYGGSGLGLAISKQFVGLMGGEIGVESQPGHGSRFWFTVPLMPAAPPPESKPSGLTERLTPLNVLIADDHDIARRVIADTAGCLGWNADTADGGPAAVELAQRRVRSGQPYDVVVVDWKMPDMDGLTVSRQIRGLSGGAQPPIVIMATAFNRDTLLHTPGAGMVDAILVKPVTASALHNAVVEARAHRGARGGDRAGDPVAGSQPIARNRLSGVRLLVVEDNAINQSVAQRVLELEGAIVALVGDGQQAVDRLKADPTAFDVVLMDVHMPVMDGYEATGRIRRDLGLVTLPIIALTAGALAEERAHAEQIGMNDFIAKPFDVDDMVGCIRRHVSLSPCAPTPPAGSNPPGASGPTAVDGPSIPGVDMVQLLHRLGGDTSLVALLIPRFITEFGDTASRVRDQMRAGDGAEATRTLHALKGAAGNMAAVDIAVLAQTAENAVKDGRHGDLPGLLKRMDAAFTALKHHTAKIPAPPPITAV
ncbi:response regulator [Azospirillum griseum]|uniref:histidine kinase n=1 Tax=Azospirillum griseum TaxID=2496639 RepID=A0A431VBN7_9PROT|nr:response regulator [Azospirillum griseum]RTR15927.1 response regulator [Azospirillum griseum]